MPLPGPARGAGLLSARRRGQRLDLIANYFLNDATAFWQLCDANNAVVPDALSAHDLVGIPPTGHESMPSTYQIFLNGQPADADLYTALSSLEVEESMDLPGAVQLTLPVTCATGDLTYVSDSRFQPMANLAVVVTPAAGSAAGSPAAALGAAASARASAAAAAPAPQCIFDGFVLSHKLHLETGNANSTLSAWGQDASWLMNLQETVKEWIDVTDADVANSIFGNYGITPLDDNLADDSPSHTESGHSLMQRARISSSSGPSRGATASSAGWLAPISPASAPATSPSRISTATPAAVLSLNDSRHGRSTRSI